VNNLKKVFTGLIALLIAVGLSACGSGSSASDAQKSGDKKEPTKLVVGASPTPHAEILEKAKPILKKKGIDLEIKKFQDYVTPNKALATGDLDANYFQHIPFLKAAEKENGYDFVNMGKIHIEPIGGYSKKYKNIDQLPDGAQVLMPGDVADQSRVLTLLDQKGVIELKKDAGFNATFDDIAKNPKHLKFKHDIDPSLMAKAYQNGEGDLDFINTNFAIDVGLH
jgi:D-methionine transport system substrate-binding protein